MTGPVTAQQLEAAFNLVNKSRLKLKKLNEPTKFFTSSCTDAPDAPRNLCKCGHDAPAGKTECKKCYQKRTAKAIQAQIAAKPKKEKKPDRQPTQKVVITEDIAKAALTAEVKKCAGCGGPISRMSPSELCPVCLAQKRSDEKMVFLADKKGMTVTEYKAWVTERAANRPPDEDRRSHRRR